MSSPLPRLTDALADRYRLERELGQGGMATVYLAQDIKHNRRVAVKVLRPELAAVIGAERFLSEITTTANLQHPHILPLFDSGEADGFLFYVMPYVEGETVRDRIEPREAAPGGRRGAHHHGGGRRARLRPPPRRDPPRHQAREHPAARRLSAGGRLRHRAGREHRRLPHDRDRHVPRHAALHEPRAGHGRAGDHRALRCVRPRLRALRDAHRRSAVHRQHRAGHRGAGRHRDAAADGPAAPARFQRTWKRRSLTSLQKLPADRFKTARSSRAALADRQYTSSATVAMPSASRPRSRAATMGPWAWPPSR